MHLVSGFEFCLKYYRGIFKRLSKKQGGDMIKFVFHGDKVY